MLEEVSHKKVVQTAEIGSHIDPRLDKEKGFDYEG